MKQQVSHLFKIVIYVARLENKNSKNYNPREKIGYKAMIKVSISGHEINYSQTYLSKQVQWPTAVVSATW